MAVMSIVSLSTKTRLPVPNTQRIYCKSSRFDSSPVSCCNVSFMSTPHLEISGVTIGANIPEECEEILTAEALALVAELHRRFDGRRRELLQARVLRQKEIDGGKLPDFLPETADIRKSNYTVAPIPADLLDRRVEITGPVERKMVINALNSGASTFMADFEDSCTPSWDNMIRGQINLRQAVDRSISLKTPEGKCYTLNETTATLIVRPRGWHLLERHMLV